MDVNLDPLLCARGNACPCPAGRYSPATNLASWEECTVCPPGSFCSGGDTAVSGPCTAGFYCPVGSEVSTPFPCPAGKFSAATDLVSEDGCQPCTVSNYCPESATAPFPCPAGRYGNLTQLTSSTDCALCPPGYTCPGTGNSAPTQCGTGRYSTWGEASTPCTPCAAGRFCSAVTTSTIQHDLNLCPAGTLCTAGTGKDPEFTNEPCPAGHYCPAGTPAAVPCPDGTYQPHLGAKSELECLLCPPGRYCVSMDTQPGPLCSTGHYCPEGSSSPTQETCPEGFYREITGGQQQADCALCPSGFVCGVATTVPSDCPRGFYCVVGVSTPEPCPPGTFSNSTNIRRVEDCTVCTPGFYCDAFGLTEPTGPCDAGYFCLGGSPTSAPVDSRDPLGSEPTPIGGRCPAGGYCPVGSSAATACPAGFFLNVTGATSADQCIPCEAGFFCLGSNAAAPTALCDPGFYCPQGSTSAKQVPTPIGHFTEAGAAFPVPCPPGRYQNQQRQSSCIVCDAQRYCPYYATNTTLVCPAGFYCPEGTSQPEPCPRGRFSSTVQLQSALECSNCTGGMYCGDFGLTAPSGQCEAGYFCSLESPVPNPGYDGSDPVYGDECPTGSFCVAGTTTPAACPVGRYQPVTRASSFADCLECPPGRYCDSSGQSSTTGDCAAGFFCVAAAVSDSPTDGVTGNTCPQGSYCPGGTSFPLTCPPGRYGSSAGLSICDVCPARSVCDGTTPTTTPPCPQGSYCPGGTDTNIPLCPPGRYGAAPSLASADECTACEPGVYCFSHGLTTPTGQCEAGYFCNGTAVDAFGRTAVGGDTFPCPAGHFCPAGTSDIEECPVGTYSPSEGNEEAADCLMCSVGSFCATPGLVAPTGDCDAGHYCARNVTVPNPTSGIVTLPYSGDVFTGSIEVGGDVCPAGHTCAAGTSIPTPCIAGTYNSLTGQTSCTPCAEGHFCLEGSTGFSGSPCPAGFFCPNGTEFATQYPCPNGTFSNTEGLSRVDQCEPCPGGSYCGGVANTAPDGVCAAGFFCLGGARTPKPTDGVTGNVCGSGTICPANTTLPTLCPPGSYCVDEVSQAPCSAGYYCIGGSFTPTPAGQLSVLGSSIGDICPRGHYCVAGTSSPQACPPATYSPTFGNDALNDCLPCQPGFYCDGNATVTPTLQCGAGHYCPGGASTPTQVVCPAGFFCPTGSALPEACAAGTYNPVSNASACLTCPEGFFCPNATVTPVDCPAGYFCPNGTSRGTEAPCPPGTFSAATNLVSVDQCTPCSPGMYCGVAGQSAPTGPCDEGFYCVSGANVSSPTYGFESGYTCSIAGWGDGDCPGDDGNSTVPGTGDICPPGHFCPAGSPNPLQCPPGTFNPAYGRSQNTSGCQPCTPGFTCPDSATVSPTVPCAATFYCPAGQSSSSLSCVAGHYCDGGDASPIPCPAGTFQASTGASTCDPCPAGSYCGNATVSPSVCPQGSFCPEGTRFGGEFLCPNGTYGNSSGLSSLSQCTECDGGRYCFPSGLTSPAGLCDAGYYCTNGSATRTPTASFNGRGPGLTGLFVGDVCPQGHYCEAGVAAPIACPVGTFSSSRSNTALSDCEDCTPGFLCPNAGTITPTVACPAGFFCPAGSSVAVNACPAGFFCPGGDESPQPCPLGAYSNTTGQSACEACPSGFFCAGATAVPSDCPPGFYCPIGTRFGSEYPCPEGTFSNSSNLMATGQCLPCSPGMYCGQPALREPSGPCGPGFYCGAGSSTPTPAGFKCSAGFICTYGSSSPTPSGTFSPNSIVDEGYPCPAGHYCLAGDTYPRGCAPGTQQPLTGQASCDPCPASLLCSGNTALGELCPVGFFCPQGSAQPQACPAGTFGAARGLNSSASCATCPPASYCVDGNVTAPCAAGFVCGSGSTTPTPGGSKGTSPNYICPRGFYCPEGSSAESACPPGTFSAALGATSAAACGPCPPGFTCADGNPIPIPCEAGHFCPGAGQQIACPRRSYNPVTESSNVTACLPCPAGFFCDDEGIADISLWSCPPGFFCPEQTSQPVQCLAGSFRDTPGAGFAEECPPCTAGSYCPTGSVSPVSCRGGTTCPPGATNETVCPAGYFCPPPASTNITAPIPCPAGSFCPEGSASPTTCPLGTCCPALLSYPLVCPKGTFSPPETSQAARTDCDIACQSCPPGTFSEATDGTACEVCSPGFVCRGGTSSEAPFSMETHSGYPCPAGHYCPAGSAVELACPRGTYNPLPGQANATACLACPVDSYNNLEGQAACRPCSSSAFAPELGSFECKCRGQYRHFQWTDGMCVCQPGYHALTADGDLVAEADGEEDCQPMTFPWCELGQQRLASGACASLDCDSIEQCPTGAGRFLPDTGVCACTGALSGSDVCGESCQATSVKLAMDRSTGDLIVTDPTTVPPSSKRLDPRDDIPGFTGTLSCVDARQRWVAQQISEAGGAALALEAASAGNGSAAAARLNAAISLAADIPCDVHSVSLSSEGFLGVFGADDSVVGASAGAGARARRRMSALRLVRAKLVDAQSDETLALRPAAAAAARSEAQSLLRDIAALTASDLAHGAATFAGLDVPPGQEAYTLRRLLADASGIEGLSVLANDTYAGAAEHLLGSAATWARLAGRGTLWARQWAAAAEAVLERPHSIGNSGDPQSSWWFSSSVRKGGRDLQSTVSSPFVSRPLTCLQLGQSLLFSLSVQSDGTKSYPVYVKDSFLNSNPGFDYGPFRQLQQQMASPELAASISTFGYTFAQAGTFVFASSSDPTNQIVVVVVEVGQQCPSTMQGLAFQPTTSENLVSLGVGMESEVHLDPNWDLLALLLSALFIILLAVVAGVYIFRHRAWGNVSVGLDAMGAGESQKGHKGAMAKEYQALIDAEKAGERSAVGSAGDAGPATDGKTAGTRRLQGGAAVGSDEWDGDSALLGGDVSTFGGELMDVEDEDLRELIRQLQAHHAEVAESFKQQQDAAQEILDALHEEADELRRMIAASTAEMAADTAVVGEGGEAAKRAAALRQMEGELHGRDVMASQMQRAEADIQAAIAKLAEVLREQPEAVAKEMLADILAADDDMANPALAGAAIRKQLPEASSTGEEVSRATQSLRDAIARFSDIVTTERKRRAEGLSVWRKAGGQGMQDAAPEAMAALDRYETALGPMDAAVAQYLGTLRAFSTGSGQYLTAQRASLRAFIDEYGTSAETQNAAVMEKCLVGHQAKLGKLVTQLYHALEVLQGRLPSLGARVRSTRDAVGRSTKAALVPLAQARTAAEEEAKAAGMTPVGLAGLSAQLHRLIETLQNSMYTPGLEHEEGAGDGEDDAATSTAAGMHGAADGLVAAVDREIEAENAELEAAIAAQQKAADEEAAVAEAEARKKLMERLADPHMTDEERQRLLAEFERDQSKVQAKLEAEKRRQAADMRAKLQQRRDERLRRKLKRAEAEAADELQRQQQEQAEALVAEQEAAAAAAAAAEEAEIAAAVAKARTELGSQDGTFDVESALRRLREEFEADQDTAAAALAAEQARQATSLQGKLRLQRRERARLAAQRRQAAMAEAGDDFHAVSRALAAEAEATAADGDAAVQANEHAKQEQSAALSAAMAEQSRAWQQRQAEYSAKLAALETAIDEEAAAKLASATASIRGQWALREAEMKERQEKELAAAPPDERPALIANHAAEASKLAAGLEHALNAAEADIDAASAAAKAQLSAEQAKSRLAAARHQGEWRLTMAKAEHELDKAAREEALTDEVAHNRAQRELELEARQAEEMAAATSDAERAALAKRHAAEMEELQRVLAREEEAKWAAAEDASKAAAVDLEAAVQRLRNEFESEADTLAGALAAERKRQKGDMKSRLAARKTRRLQAMRRRQQAELAAAASPEAAEAIAKAHAAEERDVRLALEEGEASASAALDAQAKLTVAAFDADKELARLHEQLNAEAGEREDAMDRDRRRQRTGLKRKLAERRARKLARMRAKHAEELAQAADEAARAALRAQHAEESQDAEQEAQEQEDAEVAALEAKLDVAQKQHELDYARDSETIQEQFAVLRSQADDEAERALAKVQGEEKRQAAALESRLRARKRRKMRALQRKQAAERAAATAAAAEATAEQQERVTAEVMASATKDEEFESAVLAAVRAILGDGVTQEQLRATGALARGGADDAGQEAGGGTGGEGSTAAHPGGPLAPQAPAVVDEEAAAKVAADAEAERARLASEQAEAAAEAEREAAAEAERMEAELEAERQRKVAAARAEMQARLDALNADNTEEFERIRAENEAEMARVEATLDDQKRLQQSKLSAQLAKRKARKARALQRQHAKDLAATKAAEEAALAKLQAAATANGEREALEQLLADGHSVLSRDQAGAAVEALLRERHTKESNDQLATQYAERSRVLRETLEEVLDDKAAAREELLEALKEAHAGEGEVAGELARLEDEFNVVQADAEKRALESLEVHHAGAQLQLKQRQLQELASMLKAVAPDDKDRLAEAEAALEEAAKLQAFQTNLEAERAEREAKAQADRAALEAELAAQTEAELAKQEAEMTAALEEQRRKAEAQLEQQRARMREEAAIAREARLKASHAVNEEERERVLAEFEAAQSRKEERIERQREKQQAKLSAQLAKRKLRARRKAEAENRKRVAEMRAKQDAEAKAAAEAAEASRKKLEGSKPPTPAMTPVASQSGGGAGPSKATGATPVSGAPVRGLPLAAAPAGEAHSPEPGPQHAMGTTGSQLQALQGRLGNIEKLLTQLKSGATGAPAEASGEQAAGHLFVDPASKATPVEGKLEPVKPQDLLEPEKARLDIGRRLLRAVGLDRPPAGVALQPAASLPADDYVGNAYRGTYFFDPKMRTLYIRRARFMSTGDFMVVLAHAVAHINTASGGPLANDGTPRFQAEFHRLMRAFGQELYSPAPAPAGAGMSARKPSPALKRAGSTLGKLQAAVGRMGSLRNLAGGGDVEDDDVGGAAPSTSTWAAGSLPDRVANLKMFQANRELQSYLASLEADVLEAGSADADASDDEGEEAGEADAAALSAAAVVDYLAEAPLDHSSPAAYEESLAKRVAHLQRRVDFADRSMIERAKDAQEARSRVEELQALVQAAEAQAEEVVAAEEAAARVAAAVARGEEPHAEDAAHASPATLPPRSAVLSELAAHRGSLSNEESSARAAETAVARHRAQASELTRLLDETKEALSAFQDMEGEEQAAVAAARP